jgi:hypothetical protein
LKSTNRRPGLRRAACVLIGVLVLLPGCPSPSFRYVLLEEPVVIRAKGDFVHEGTGIVFPWAVAGFIRAEVDRYDADGHDVGAHYKCYRPKAGANPGSPFATISIYVYPALENDREHLDRIAREIRKQHADVRCIRKGPGAFALGGRTLEGWTLRHELRDPAVIGYEDRTSRTMLVRLDGTGTPDWFLKYRITWATDRTPEVEPEVERFLEKLTIP